MIVQHQSPTQGFSAGYNIARRDYLRGHYGREQVLCKHPARYVDVSRNLARCLACCEDLTLDTTLRRAQKLLDLKWRIGNGQFVDDMRPTETTARSILGGPQ